MGRLAKPDRIHDLAANPGKRPRNRRAPMAKNSPRPPEIMTTIAQCVWKRIIASMPNEVYTAVDSSLLAAYCEAVALHQEAIRVFEQDPRLIVEGSTGQEVENPLLKIIRAQSDQITKIGARLGLDPISRQSINAVKEEEPVNEFLN